MQLWSQFIRRGANGEKELFQCPQISGFLFYLPSTTPNILITSIFDSTYTYTVPIRFGKHVAYALTFGSDAGCTNLVFINKDSFTASARAAAILALTSTLPSGEAYPLITTLSQDISSCMKLHVPR